MSGEATDDTLEAPRQVGVDVGSTTLKVVVVRRGGITPEVLRYARHHGDLLGTLRALLGELLPERATVGLTGSGAGVAEHLGASEHHEVTAALEAVRRLHPEARTVIDLGGQDAKLVTFEREGAASSRPLVTMNDRCAAGTGVTLDRCLRRLGVCPERAARVRYRPDVVLPLAARCGVFAETDLVNLARRGEDPERLVVSLADAIVRACLSVLARGVTPRPPVVLLGGPHAFFPALASAWEHHLAALWDERGIAPDPSHPAVLVPERALYYPALGAAWRSEREGEPRARASWRATLEAVQAPSAAALERPFEPAPWSVERPPWPASTARREGYFLGFDAGSTVTKAVLLDRDANLLAHAERASGAPLDDARALLDAMRAALSKRDPEAGFTAIAATGYGARWVGPLVGASLEVVETVAHARSARAVCPEVEVVCDVGGQDVKVLALDPHGSLRDFRVSSHCIAGIGAALEATASELGVARDRYAEVALGARRAPRFEDGCVVFLDAARVGYQREGYAPGELLAGLARALPRVIWTQVMNGVHPGALGRVVLLQGGVQHNEAALRAQVEHLRASVEGVRVLVHPHPGLAGALGAALLARESLTAREVAPRSLPVASFETGEHLRCALCENRCPRARVTLDEGSLTREVVTGHGCDAGASLSLEAGASRRAARARDVPDLYSFEARRLFLHDPAVRALRTARRRVRVGVPRVLAQYRAAPFFRAWLEALGVAPSDVVYSPPTSDALWKAGAHHGANDPCFPVKVTLAHVHHLLRTAHAREPLDALFVPRVTHAVTPVRHTLDCASCPVVAASPALVRAAFPELSRSGGGPAILDPEVALSRPELLRSQLFEAFQPLLGMTRDESDEAVRVAAGAVARFEAELHARAREVLSRATSRGLGVALVLARPYHVDPGISHHMGLELQALGLPSLSVRALPRDEPWLRELFSRELAAGALEDPFDVRDLLPESDNSGASERLWAARVAARHGALGVVDLSSFKCAQDAPTHAPVRDLLSGAGVAYCALHDLDEHRPRTSLGMRLRTFVEALRARGLSPWR